MPVLPAPTSLFNFICFFHYPPTDEERKRKSKQENNSFLHERMSICFGPQESWLLRIQRNWLYTDFQTQYLVHPFHLFFFEGGGGRLNGTVSICFSSSSLELSVGNDFVCVCLFIDTEKVVITGRCFIIQSANRLECTQFWSLVWAAR